MPCRFAARPFDQAVRGNYHRSMQEALELTKRFLRVHGNEWHIECEVRQLDGPEFGCRAP